MSKHSRVPGIAGVQSPPPSYSRVPGIAGTHTPPPHTRVSLGSLVLITPPPPRTQVPQGSLMLIHPPHTGLSPGSLLPGPPPPHTHVSPGSSMTRQLRATMGARWCSVRTSARRSPALVVKSFSRTSSKLPQMPHSRPAHVSGTHTVAVVFPSKFTDAPNDVSRRTSRPLLVTLDWRMRFRGSDAFTPFI